MKKNMIVGALVASLTLTAVPAYAAVSSWGLDRLDQATATFDGNYSVPLAGAGVTAYVLDTGVALSDAGFGGRASGDVDCHGHGTHVAGIIGSSEFGVAKNVKIVSIKVADCKGVSYPQDLVAGIDRVIAMNKGPAVVNISVTVGKSATVDAAIDRLYKAGILPVVAASNTMTDACKWSPSGTPNAFTVASINKNDQRTTNSAFGECVDIFAPGGLIDSEDWQRPTAYKTMTGTSMATPHVTGVAALYLEKNPTAKPAEVAGALRAGALKDVVIDARSVTGNYLLNTMFLGGIVSTPVVTEPVTSAPVASTPAPVATPKPAVTAIPAKVSGVFASKATAGYKLSWTAPTNAPTAGIIGYKVESSANGRVWTTVATTVDATTSAVVPVTGYYRVSAIGSLGTGQPSLTVRVR
jgi:subtilisin family serine protease